MRVKDRDGNMLIEGMAARHRWDEYLEELLNVQASVVTVGSDRRMPVFSRLNDRGVESYEV